MAMNIPLPLKRLVAALRVQRSDPQRGGFLGFFRNTTAGVNVTHEGAEQVAAIWACMDVIASALSSSDWNVYGGVRDADNKEHLVNDSLQYILNTRMNSEMTAQAGKRAIALAAVGHGNGYAEIERDMAGRIIALWPISPSRVEPRRDTETGRLFYRVTQEMGGGWVDMDPEDLFIVRGASLVGFAGDDAIRRAIQTVATAIAIDQYAGAFFGNGAQLGTIFTYKGKMADPERERLKDQIRQRHQGVRNAFQFGLFDGAGEWDIKSTGVDAEKSQLIEVKHLSVEEICRWFRVPPHKIAHLLRATNNNIEHQGLEFSRDALRPWKKEIEQEADYKLVPYRGPSKFIEIDVDWAEQGDYKSRAEAYAILRNMGAFSANDVLRKLGENTIGPAGDIRIVQGANVRLEDVGAAYGAPGQEQNNVVAAWLASVYERIDARQQNRAEQLQQAGRPDWLSEARASTKSYALAQVSALSDVLGERLTKANEWAFEVINGCDPKIAARAALEQQE